MNGEEMKFEFAANIWQWQQQQLSHTNSCVRTHSKDPLWERTKTLQPFPANTFQVFWVMTNENNSIKGLEWSLYFQSQICPIQNYPVDFHVGLLGEEPHKNHPAWRSSTQSHDGWNPAGFSESKRGSQCPWWKHLSFLVGQKTLLRHQHLRTMQVQTVYQEVKHIDVHKPKPLKNNDILMHNGKKIYENIFCSWFCMWLVKYQYLDHLENDKNGWFS